MYTFLLYAHSYFRWAVLAAAIYALVLAFRGVSSKAPWTPADRKAQLAFTTALDVQVLLGILLFIISPLIRSAMGNMAGAMKSAPIRFFMIEHIFMMLIAVAVLHIFAARSKKAPDDATRHRRWRTGVLVSLLAILAGIPWSFLAYGRPLFRM